MLFGKNHKAELHERLRVCVCEPVREISHECVVGTTLQERQKTFGTGKHIIQCKWLKRPIFELKIPPSR